MGLHCKLARADVKIIVMIVNRDLAHSSHSFFSPFYYLSCCSQQRALTAWFHYSFFFKKHFFFCNLSICTTAYSFWFTVPMKTLTNRSHYSLRMRFFIMRKVRYAYL